MTTYYPEKISIPTGLDDQGLRLSLQRLPKEPLSDYRRRLLAEARDPIDPTQESFIRTAGRTTGHFDSGVFDIDLVLDSNGDPTAVDPMVEVTSTRVRLYSDYQNRTVDVEVDLTDRSAGYWLVDAAAALSTATHFTVTNLDDYQDYARSSFRYDTSTKFNHQHPLFKSYQNHLPHNYIKEAFFTDITSFNNLVASQALVVEDGDYYIDTTTGNIISNLTPSGQCSYSYGLFPYRIYNQPVRVIPLNDDDLKYVHSDNLVSDNTGELEPLALNSKGASIYNEVLGVHPLGWGE